MYAESSIIIYQPYLADYRYSITKVLDHYINSRTASPTLLHLQSNAVKFASRCKKLSVFSSFDTHTYLAPQIRAPMHWSIRSWYKFILLCNDSSSWPKLFCGFFSYRMINTERVRVPIAKFHGLFSLYTYVRYLPTLDRLTTILWRLVDRNSRSVSFAANKARKRTPSIFTRRVRSL